MQEVMMEYKKIENLVYKQNLIDRFLFKKNHYLLIYVQIMKANIKELNGTSLNF